MDSFEEFKPYLEAVEESGSRSRSVIYINIILIAIGITMLRNYTYPTWDIAHFRESVMISKCLSQLIRNRSVMEKENCDHALKDRFNTNIEEITNLNPNIPKDTVKDQKTKGDLEQAEKALDEITRIDSNNAEVYAQARLSIEKLLQKSNTADIDPFTKTILKFVDSEIAAKVKREYFEIPLFGYRCMKMMRGWSPAFLI